MSELLDLSHTIDVNIPVYPGTPSPVLKKIAKIEKEGYSDFILTLSTHTGTHIDVESHVVKNGKTICDYALDHFYGTALTIDCSEYKLIESDHLQKVLKDIRLPDFLLLFTNWDKYWGRREYFTGYPVLSTSAAKYLSKLSIKGLGIDAISFDSVDNDTLTNHNILLIKGIILIENLHGMNRILSKEIIFSCFPLKLENADSSPVRACAIINNQ